MKALVQLCKLEVKTVLLLFGDPVHETCDIVVNDGTLIPIAQASREIWSREIQDCLRVFFV